jgi:riboflavin synthase alpha subunit
MDVKMNKNLNFPEKVVRITYSQEDEEMILNYLKSNNTFYYTTRFGRPMMTDNIEIGCNCINGIDYNIAKSLQEQFNIKIDNITNLITKETIEQLQAGQKVQFELNSFTKTIGKGTVESNDGQVIEIKKYRSKNKIYQLFIGQDCNLVMGW